MSSDERVILSVNSLTKCFKVDDNELWGVNDVSFDLHKGEILGVIGRNGAGKSTLLKILSQITAPTDGTIEYEGKLTSILEIGTGFHAELTGKENVYLGASIMGMSRKQVDIVYDEIVHFSGLEEHMNRAVKQYSSGMYLRLAFSVAFHCEIDILLLDEVFAVGDVNFRRKCFDRIRALKQEGVSIILISHFMEPIVSFCDRCLLMEEGKILHEGPPLDTIEHYLELSGEKKNSVATKGGVNYLLDWDKVKVDGLIFTDFSIEDAVGKHPNLDTSSPILINMTLEKTESNDSFEVVYYLRNMNDIRVLIDSHGLREDYEVSPMPAGRYSLNCTIPGELLSRGVYTLGVMICKNDIPKFEEHNLATFRVKPLDNRNREQQITSVIRPKLAWTIDYQKKD